MSKVGDLILQICKPLIKDQSTRAKVLSVDMTAQTIEVETLNRGSLRFEVKLRAISDNEETGFILYPKVDSIVCLSIIDNNLSDCYISQYSELDGFSYVISNLLSLKSTDDGKVVWTAVEIFFDGATNGLVKIPQLESRVNDCINAINTLQSQMGSHTHPETGATTGPSGIISTPLANVAANDFKHDKIEF